MTELASTIGAISSLVGTATVAYVAIDARATARRTAKDLKDAELHRTKSDAKVDAVARTSAATAVNVAAVGTKVDTNTKITEAVHTEVKAINGTTGVELLEATEGRRIEADIDPEDRTRSEDGYVRRLHEDEPPGR